MEVKAGTYEEITARMRETGGLKNDSAIARALKITPQALSNYKKRNKMPASLVVKFADKYDCSLDYLFCGIGEGAESGAPYLEMAAVPADISMQAFNMIFNAVGFKLKPFELVKMTDADMINRNRALGITVPTEAKSDSEPALKVASEDTQGGTESQEETDAGESTREETNDPQEKPQEEKAIH